jgi:hypothetical protein
MNLLTNRWVSSESYTVINYWMKKCWQIASYGSYINSRSVSRCFDQRRRLRIFNFFRSSAAAVKKPSGNWRQRLKNVQFFLTLGGGGWNFLTIFSKNVLFLRNRGMKKAKLITGNVLRRNYIRGALEIDPEYS